VGSAQGATGLGKYLMRSPTGEVIFGGETTRFSKKVRRTGINIYISILPVGFMQKRQNRIGFPLIRKVRRDL
jgi:hypothetical protein